MNVQVPIPPVESSINQDVIEECIMAKTLTPEHTPVRAALKTTLSALQGLSADLTTKIITYLKSVATAGVRETITALTEVMTRNTTSYQYHRLPLLDVWPLTEDQWSYIGSHIQRRNGHWLWTGTYRVDRVNPVVYFRHEGSARHVRYSVRQIMAWEYTEMDPADRIYRTCRDPRCVHPAHLTNLWQPAR